jgi:RNA polymerase sigma factor (sigma-70 family)
MWTIALDECREEPPARPETRASCGQTVLATARGRMKEPARTPTTAQKGEDPLRECIAAMQKGDQAALGRLYDLTAARLYGVVNRIVRQPELAEEVLADVFFQVWRDCARHDPARGQVIAWLLIICRTRALDALRRRDEAVSHPDPSSLQDAATQADSADAPDELLASLEASSELAAALAVLAPLQRQLIGLAFYKGLSHGEIAAHCGLPLGSVKTHLRRALQTLRETSPSLAQFLD